MEVNTICVIGAGTMGSGIAQVAAQSGFYTLLFDINTDMLEKAKVVIEKNLQHLTDKQKITEAEKDTIFQRIQFVNDTNDCLADVFIEAIIEKLDAKVALFNQLAEVNHSEVIFASNTSSLSISDIQAKVIHSERVVGMHFFNPAPLMKLVEVIKGRQTSNIVVAHIAALCKKLNKVPVLCKDAPGFIVN
ncbi:MAG: 3-hydroxyacyl-CoA dehydrogenase NAD-binding domain-containing protein, partial [Ferruginibacter sp.]